MKFNPKSADFVCEIEAFDFKTAAVSDFEMLKKALYKYKVLVLKDQKLTETYYEQLIGCLGAPIPHVLDNYAVAGHRNIIKISNFVDERGVALGVIDGGAYWHSDMSYLQQLGVGTALYCINTPAQGGETHFIDCAQGLRLLLKEAGIVNQLNAMTDTCLSDIKVKHRFGNRRRKLDISQPEQVTSPRQRAKLSDVVHNLIEPHPMTGEPSLFAVAGTGIEIEGLSVDDSNDLLNKIEDLLVERIINTSGYYRHKYSKGDLVIWDNMAILHKGHEITPTQDYQNCRLLYRMNFSYNKDDI